MKDDLKECMNCRAMEWRIAGVISDTELRERYCCYCKTKPSTEELLKPSNSVKLESQETDNQ